MIKSISGSKIRKSAALLVMSLMFISPLLSSKASAAPNAVGAGDGTTCLLAGAGAGLSLVLMQPEGVLAFGFVMATQCSWNTTK